MKIQSQLDRAESPCGSLFNRPFLLLDFIGRDVCMGDGKGRDSGLFQLLKTKKKNSSRVFQRRS